MVQLRVTATGLGVPVRGHVAAPGILTRWRTTGSWMTGWQKRVSHPGRRQSRRGAGFTR